METVRPKLLLLLITLIIELKRGIKVKLFTKRDENKITYYYRELDMFYSTVDEILEVEKIVLDAMKETFESVEGDDDCKEWNPELILLADDVLQIIPHGFVCLHGPTRESIERLGGIPFAVKDFPKEGEEFPFQVNESGRVRLNFIMGCEPKLPEDSYIMLICEGGNHTTPGGKRMMGEDSKTCALRELQEETGVVIDSTRDCQFVKSDAQKAIVFFYEV